MIPLIGDLVLYALSGVFAGITSATSTLDPHRVWGGIAIWGYLAAALLVFLWRQRLWLTVLTWIATAVVPLVVLAWRDRGQEEVFVVEHSAQRLLETGTPYMDRASIAALPEPLLGYTPYQPLMSVFGLPRAAFGNVWWTDARIWFALATAAAIFGAARMLWPDEGLVRAIQFSTVVPLCALTLATGGDDMPVLALCLLAFALAARRENTWAAVAVGLAAAMKLFAWPIALVLAIYTRNLKFAAAAFGIPLLAMVPALIVDAGAFVENVIRFPTGSGLVTSPAASPLLGYQLAQHVPGGRTIALALLIAAGAAIGIYLLRRPPRDVGAVATVCAIGLLAAIVLMPSTRFGYLLYPVAFAFWVMPLRRRHQSDDGASN